MIVFSAVLPAISSPDLGNAPVVGNGAVVFSSFLFTAAPTPEIADAFYRSNGQDYFVSTDGETYFARYAAETFPLTFPITLG